MSDERLYRTDTALRRTLDISYPVGDGSIVLRTEQDWDRDVEPVAVSEDRNRWTFEIEADQPFLYFKPCLVRDGERRWSVGANKLLLMAGDDAQTCSPYFFGTGQGSFSQLVEIESKILDRPHRARVHVPPGYDENTTATYPVIFMQDGQNLFFPEEAFMGREWKVDETSQTLAAMNAVEHAVFVGLYSGDRMKEYTRPGYEPYGRALVEEVVPEAHRLLRLKDHRRWRSVWGSSLGGVVSFYCVWQYPEVFGSAVCMSSTFSYRDNLLDRVLSEPRRDVGFYLDSGWPGDNYEVTVAMAMALASRGWTYGRDLFHLSFPLASHDEGAWSVRLHPDLRRLMAARVMTGQGRMDAIKIALKEFEDTQGWKVVEKTEAQMEAVTSRNNIVTLRAELRQVWINKDRAARHDPDAYYQHVVHDLSAHALAGRGGVLTEHHLPFVGVEFRGGLTDGLSILEQSISRYGNTDWITRTFGSRR